MADAKTKGALAAPVAAAEAVVAKVAAKAKPAVRQAKAAATALPAEASDIIKAAKSAVTTAAESVATTVQKDDTIMATTFETPKMFTDMNDRAKATVEKTQKFAADMGDFGKGNIEAMVEAGKIAAKHFETLGQDNAEYTRRSFEGMTTAFKNMSSIKSPTEFFTLQSEFARSAFDAAVQQTSKNTEAMIKLASDAVQPLSNRFAVAVEKAKTAA